MAAKGNKVVSGCAVTEDATPDLTIDVAAGTVIANGIVVAVSADAAFAGTPNTFSTSQGNLTSGQSQFVFVHVDSSGTITNTEGTAAAAGQQQPPEVPEDETILAMITLSEGDTTIDTVDIEDWRQFTSDGIAFADNKKIWLGDPTAGGSIYFNGTNIIFDSQEFGSGDFQFDNGKLGIGIAPTELLSLSGGSTDRIFFDSTAEGITTISQTHGGVLLTHSSGGSAGQAYTPGLLFGSTDSSLSTTNPSWFAGIIAKSTETYGDDDKSGMLLEFFTTADGQGPTPAPSSRMIIDQDGNVSISNSLNMSDTANTWVKLPYLSAAPSSPVNGMVWMESDGLHLYYAGAEKLVAGV